MWLRRKKRKRVMDSNSFNRRLVSILGVERVFEISVVAAVGDVPRCYIGMHIDDDEMLQILELVESCEWGEVKNDLSECSSEEEN